jgi:hypothetical protein
MCVSVSMSVPCRVFACVRWCGRVHVCLHVHVLEHVHHHDHEHVHRFEQGGQTKRPETKCLETKPLWTKHPAGQNVRRDKTSGQTKHLADKTSGGKNIRRDKPSGNLASGRQNVQRQNIHLGHISQGLARQYVY